MTATRVPIADPTFRIPAGAGPGFAVTTGRGPDELLKGAPRATLSNGNVARPGARRGHDRADRGRRAAA